MILYISSDSAAEFTIYTMICSEGFEEIKLGIMLS